MNKKIIFRVLAAILGLIFLMSGIFLFTPVFDSFLDKVNGFVFIFIAFFMAHYAFTGKEKLFSKK